MIESNKTKFTSSHKERIISGFITILISGSILIFILTYKTIFITITPPSYIDITFEMEDLGANYGTDEVGSGEEEPADQDVLLGEGGDPIVESTESTSSTSSDQQENNSFLTNPKSEIHVSAPNKQTETKKKNTTPKQNTNAKAKTTSKKSNSKQGTKNGITTGGNPKGTTAVGNLIKGKGTVTASTGQGTGGKPGQNQGVETGGNGNGGEGIGNGRKLISYIPGTMGRGGKVPVHDCNASGTIIFSYTVDKNGTVILVNRKSGTSNTCLVNTGIKWIKQYVRADKGTRSVSGTYRINF